METPRPGKASPKRLASLAKMGEAKAYAKNEILFAEGEKSDTLFILLEGRVKVFTRDSIGRELVYNILEPGELFGEMFLDGGSRSASVRATTPSKCIVLDEVQIKSLIRKHADFAETLLAVLIARLRHATHMIKDLVLNDVRGRTAALLNQMAVLEGKTRVVPATLTQQEIGDRVGATREMVNQVIAEFIKAGLMTRDQKRRLVFTKDLPVRN